MPLTQQPPEAPFQSDDHPDRYIRHYAYYLKLDPITTARRRHLPSDKLTRPGCRRPRSTPLAARPRAQRDTR